MSDNELYHYGTKYHSGRYPYGSGENPYQHDPKGFYKRYKQLLAEGKTQKEMCEEFGISSTVLRSRISAAKDAEIIERDAEIIRMKEDGRSNVYIAEKLGVTEGTIRNTIKNHEAGKIGAAKQTADFLESKIKELGPIDVGAGVEKDLNVKRTKFNTAVQMLVDQGYEKHNIKVEQATNPGKYTTVEVLAPPGTTWAELYYNLDKINTLTSYSEDNGQTYRDVVYPRSISSDRIKVRYGDQGGKEKDGLIELRPGVEDITLGGTRYSQARILVDDNLYLKGMAVYGDPKDFPKGVDIIFNSNKSSDKPLNEVLKSTKDDPENPFGALIKANGQTHYIDKDGKDQISVVNKVRDESDWDDYSKNLSSQFLSKQPINLVKSQLNLARLEKEDEYNDIISLTNPTVKQRLLESFADDCDAAAVKLKAAEFPRQTTKVLIPIPSLKEGECYCPSLRPGEQVALVRYPHEGIFQIPIVTVNNNNDEGKKILGSDVSDVIGINSKTANQLSGADFDGDTVIAIPLSSKVRIKNAPPLEKLKDFDPSESYPYREGCKLITTDRQRNIEMGKASNLISDMTLKGASLDEIARATRYSMTVIDAKKHKLDYTRSYKENDIASLKEKYQGGVNRGASTLISKAKAETRVPERRYAKTDAETGEKIWINSNRTYKKYKKDKDGNIIFDKDVLYTEKSTKMAEVKDAYELIDKKTGTKIEMLYADYANSMKALANQARKEAYHIKPMETNKEAKTLYLNEINSLDAKLNKALMNAPKERASQVKAAAAVQNKKKYYKNKGEEYPKGEQSKDAQRVLTSARISYGAKMSGEKGSSIKITDKEWEAIQNGAITSNKLKQILNYTDTDLVKQLATPRETKKIPSSKAARIKAMINNGYTLQDIADAVGVSVTTVSSISKEMREN